MQLEVLGSKSGVTRKASEPVLGRGMEEGVKVHGAPPFFFLKSWCTPTIPALREAKVVESRVRQAWAIQ